MAEQNRPETTNFLSPNGFLLTIDKLPGVSFFSQEVTLPEISLPSAAVAAPHLPKVPFSGDSIDFSPFTINFMIDENLENFKQAFDWIIGLGAPQSYDQFKKFLQEQDEANKTSRLLKEHSDGMLQILSAHNTTIAEIRFVDLTPVSLAGVPLSSMNTSVDYVQASMTLEYTHFYFE